MLARLAALAPTHIRRSEESTALQQFSTPIALGFAASAAAAITSGDRVLEPSAGTGLLAVFAALAGGILALNELAETRADLLGHLFPGVAVSRHDAAQIHDYLDSAIAPSVVLMNPPFSVAAHVEGRMADAAFRHVASALARLTPGGRLVAITGISLAPDNPSWREVFVRLQARGRVVFSAGIDRRLYARHGTAVETRLTVIDRVPAEDPTAFPPCPGIAPDAATLLEWVTRLVPPLPVLSAPPVAVPAARPKPSRAIVPPPHPTPIRHPEPAIDPGPPLAYEVREEPPPESDRISDALYESYSVQTIAIPDARPHPTKLVQSAAMASVAPPRPSYRPHLPPEIVSSGLLSDAQIESEIVEHALSPEQVRIYDAYAEAFQVIHANLAEALEAANVTRPSGTLNRQAKAAARSAFESNKQRFFNHLITAMKVPTLIGAIQRDIAAGAACIVQLVSTCKAGYYTPTTSGRFTMSDQQKHIDQLFTAELQFRLASAVRLAVTLEAQPLDLPIEWAHGKHKVRYEEIALRPDQAEYAADFLQRAATFLMAVAINDAITFAVPAAEQSRDMDVRGAFQIARLIRNAFAHGPLSPTWLVPKKLRGAKFEVSGIIALNTTGIHGSAFDWRHYGGPLALFRLNQFTRIKILLDDRPARKLVPLPSKHILQLGDLILQKIDEIPPTAIEVTERRPDGGIDLGGGYVIRSRNDE